MDPELVALATTGATVLISQMVKDGWAQAKDGFSKILAKGSQGGRTLSEEDLERSREEIIAAEESGDDEVRDDVVLEWRGRFRRLLRAHPELASEFSDLIREHDDQQSSTTIGDIKMSAKAEDNGRIYQQGQGTQING